MTLAKICGLKTHATVTAARDAGADYAGFVAVERSPRFVDPALAKALGEASGMRRVGLFVDPGDADIAAYRNAIDIIQLHGNEPPKRTAELRAKFGLPVWKALGIRTRQHIRESAAYAGAADRILLDSRAESGDLQGGRGVRFDWTLLKDWRPALPWGLAGGLTPHNVAEAIRATGAPLVDTSSGVEEAPGIKDEGKIRAFMDAVKTA